MLCLGPRDLDSKDILRSTGKLGKVYQNGYCNGLLWVTNYKGLSKGFVYVVHRGLWLRPQFHALHSITYKPSSYGSQSSGHS